MKTDLKIVQWFAGAALLLVLGVAVALWSFKQIGNSASARQQTYSAIVGAHEFRAQLREAEAGQQGYLLTGDEAKLKPYQAARKDLGPRLDALRQLKLSARAPAHLAALTPLIDALLAEWSASIELRRTQGIATSAEAVRRGQSARLMDSIHTELNSFTEAEEEALARHEGQFRSSMRQMFTIIVSASLFALLFAFSVAWLIYRQTQQRIEDMVHAETRHLLETQEETNQRLQQANLTLRDSEENYAVTLNSIGDAVIATDADARITRLNPVAERLTGWTQADAAGRPVDEIFQIISQETREPSRTPVMETLELGTVQGRANPTLLIARDGSECAIADSCAPIRDRNDRVIGAVLVFRNVTEEYVAQQALHDSAALIQTILNTVVDGIITLRARGGLIETINPAAERMFGYEAAELIGQSFSLLIPELDGDQVRGSLDYYSASEEARAAGLGRETIGRRKDGSSFPLEIAVSEMTLGGQRYFTGLLRDITARKHAEEALLKAGALQNAILSSATFSSIATDAKGVIQIFNVGAERMLGFEAEEVINKITPAEISDPEEVIARARSLSEELSTPIAPGFEALAFKASRGIEDIYELSLIRKDGSRFPAVLSVTALRDPHETIIGYLLIGIDNSARKRVEAERAVLDQELLDKNAELESARIVADKANLAKSDFLSSMSHELRTPLSAILGFAQLMETGSPAPTPTQLRSINQILQAGWYLLDLINEILDLALIESGKLSLSLETVGLAEVMHECRAMMEAQAQKRDIAIEFPSFAAPRFVCADRTRLKQILINLLSNAIKYNRDGGKVVVDCAVQRSDSIRISVRDTGAGLDEQQLAQLFQPFNRLGQEANSEEGTGIGLVVCKRLIELMGGVIGVESTVGQGSVFWIEMTLMSGHPAPDLSAELAAIVQPEADGGDQVYTLLYVEDNPANLMLVEDIIARRPDIHLLTARDGILGVEMARAALPDVILMDINLPGISGLHALQILANNPATAHIPVVALSANAIPRDIEKGLEAGFFRYLTKPLKVIEFMDTLDIALRFAKTNAALATEKRES